MSGARARMASSAIQAATTNPSTRAWLRLTTGLSWWTRVADVACRVSPNRSGVPQLRANVDASADRPGDRAALDVQRVRPLGRLSLVLRAVPQQVLHPDPPDDEDLVLDDHVSLRRRLQPPVAGVDSARLQRATESAGQSTGGGGDDVVERRRA